MSATMTAADPSLTALRDRAREALAHWNIGEQEPQLLKHRENAVFRIALAGGKPAALRLHRAGYHDEQALASELAWMAALGEGGFRVPAPIATADGRHSVALGPSGGFGAQHADIVSWMAGEPLGESGVPLPYPVERLAVIFRALGTAMAQLHNAADAWTPPGFFQRPSWDADGLLGEAPLWGRFWDCDGLSADHARRLSALRTQLRRRLDALTGPALDYGLIHADLVRENVLVHGDDVELIDFDDCGHGWRLFEIATTLYRNRVEPHYPTIKASLIAGYRSARPLPDAALQALPLFMTLRALTYVGWLGQRPGSPDRAARMHRNATESLALGQALLDA